MIHTDIAVFPFLTQLIDFYAWSGGAQKYFAAILTGKHDGGGAGVVAGSGILLLE